MKNDENSALNANGQDGPVAEAGMLNLGDKIYEIRGEKVMLDFDLAEIYGYETKAFNRQANRNIEKFDPDFRFQLTREEVIIW